MTPADCSAAFVAGARWWAEREAQELDTIAAEINAMGAWPAGYVGRAFVNGAKWQEFHATDATMWTRDQDEAEFEAERRYPIEAKP